jgi:hypothetical protein
MGLGQFFFAFFGFLFRKQIIGRIRPSAGTGIAAACRRPASDGYHSFGHWDTAEAFLHARFAARLSFMAKVPFFLTFAVKIPNIL